MFLAVLLWTGFGNPAHAQDAGDPVAGENEFRKCRACHMIQDDQGVDIQRGGKAGPNLWNVIGRRIASDEEYRYGPGILEVAEAKPDLVWTEDELVSYITDPNGWLRAQSGDPAARTKMTFRLREGQADLAAYLASVSSGAGETEAATE
ncbi:cytochrome C [Paracoccus caeni]|uniref:Cytochrome C n=2 Tax=Paracoccus caeni TaxID=657651 RepID=A0A934SFS6_9RHOB|nr:cytochrome C [Paracoccus caeni]